MEIRRSALAGLSDSALPAKDSTAGDRAQEQPVDHGNIGMLQLRDQLRPMVIDRVTRARHYESVGTGLAPSGLLQ